MNVQCCIAGGGPAGVMLGYLLARAGVEVAVLEKHGDFLRDFRGDTVHPSTMTVLDELGLLDGFLARKHSEIKNFTMRFEGQDLQVVDFAHVDTKCKFIAFMPQWDFLDFLSEEAKKFPSFHLLLNTEATDLVRDGNRVTGVRAKGPDGEITISSTLVVGADGRHSTLRDKAQFPRVDIGAPIDVLWFRVSRKASDPTTVLGNIVSGTVVITIDRNDYWQCAYVIAKGELNKLKAAGVAKVRENVARAVPFLADRVDEIKDFDELKLLEVTIDRLTKWYMDGLICIGDAAHAMSPIGGVGINLAIQDAVATANAVAQPLLDGTLTTKELAGVQERRTYPTKMIQRVQVLAQDNILKPAISGGKLKVPWMFKLLGSVPYLQRFPAQFLGVGPRPEHVHTPIGNAKPAR